MEFATQESSDCVHDIEDDNNNDLIPGNLIVCALSSSDSVQEGQVRIKECSGEDDECDSKHQEDG